MKKQTLAESLQTTNSDYINEFGYQVKLIKEEKTMKAIREKTELSRIEIARLLDIPKVTIDQWEQNRRKPTEFNLNLIEYWLKNEGYLKREFYLGFETYNEKIAKRSDCIDWDCIGEPIYADSVEEAIDLALDYLIDRIIAMNSESPIEVSDESIRTYGVEIPYGIEPYGNKLVIGEKEVHGIKRNDNNELEIYDAILDEESEDGYKLVLAKTLYVQEIHEHILTF